VPEPTDLILDTPQGIVSAHGVHFRTTRALLEDYAGPVLEVVPLATLIGRAEVWLRGGPTVALWVLAPLLLLVPPWWAAAAALGAYVAWETAGPLWVSRRLVAALRVLERPLVQAALYVAVLSVLAARGQVVAVGVGLLGFVLMRWGVVLWVLRPAVRVLRRPLTTLPAPDQVLRAFVLRAALRHGIALPQLDRLKRELRS
jgi:hypothetical protein